MKEEIDLETPQEFEIEGVVESTFPQPKITLNSCSKFCGRTNAIGYGLSTQTALHQCSMLSPLKFNRCNCAYYVKFVLIQLCRHPKLFNRNPAIVLQLLRTPQALPVPSLSSPQSTYFFPKSPLSSNASAQKSYPPISLEAI
jgi:hypothetical protein